MSLFVPSEGLLGTHISWSEVQSAVQQSLKTTATFGKNKTITNIGDQKGMFSRVGLVEPDWEGAGKDEKLPSRFVVKMPSQLAIVESSQKLGLSGGEPDEAAMKKLAGVGDVIRMFHNREIDVYKLLMKQKNPSIPYTKLFASKKFDEKNQLKGYIISQYFPNLYDFSVLDSISPTDIKPVIKSLAAFSAIGEKVNRDELNFAQGPDFIDLTYNQLLEESMLTQFKGLLTMIVPDKDLVGKLIQLADSFYLNAGIVKQYKSINDLLNVKTVLTHGDAWSPNVLLSKNGDKLEFKALIDYQTASVCNPAQDVSKLFLSCLSRTDRRAKQDELMRVYYDYFIQELNGKPVPYTLQQLKESYCLYFPLMALMISFGLAAKTMFITGEDAEKKKAAGLDKMIGLLEDIVSVHEKNIKQFPDFYKF